MLKRIILLTGLLCLGFLASCAGAERPAAGNSPSNPSEPEGGLLQFSQPRPGDTKVILHTNMGDITIRLFPEEAPMAYENFTTHARNGFYDNVIFHRVIHDFMIQGGDPEGTGMGGESIWGHGFGPEFSMYLRHFRGALAMAQSAMPNSIGSQFYIVHNTDIERFASPQILGLFEHALDNQDELVDEGPDGERVYMRDLLSTEMIEAYKRYGGTPHLDLILNPSGHTVFGQVVDGMDVVDAIAEVEVGAADRPLEDVVILSTTVTEF